MYSLLFIRLLTQAAQRRSGSTQGEGLRTRLNIELNFPPKLRGARSRLYRRRFLQVNTRWKALDAIYKIRILLHRSDFKISVKNRQTFFENK